MYVLRNVLHGLVSYSVLLISTDFAIATMTKNQPKEDKQPSLSQKGCLKGSDAQKWCFSRLLPLIFSPDRPVGNVSTINIPSI